jgi:hypothetical protein
MSPDSLTLFLIATVTAVVVVLAVRHWRPAILGTFVLLVFEGALRKWAFPSAQAQIYLVKDVILVGAYIGFMTTKRTDPSVLRGMTFIRAVLFLAFGLGCIEIFNPNSPSLLVGIIGLKAYFLYVPLAFTLPYIFRSREHLFRMIRLSFFMAIPVAILGFIQIASGPDSILNTYVAHDERPAELAVFGQEHSFVRTSGTFSYISGYTTFLTVTALLAIGYNMARGWHVKRNILPFVTLTLVIGAMFTTGSRGPVFTLIVAAPFILFFALKGGILSVQTAMRLCLLLPIMIVSALNVSPEAFEAFAYRATEGDVLDNVMMHAFSPVSQVIEALANSPVFGTGIGTTHNSAPAITGASWPWWLGDDLFFEEETARVTVELGFIGFLLIFALRVAIVVFAVRCMTSFKDRGFRALAIVLVPYLTIGGMGQIINNVTADFYYWAAVGLLLAMRRLEHSARVGRARELALDQARVQVQPIHAK